MFKVLVQSPFDWGHCIFTGVSEMVGLRDVYIGFQLF